MEPDNKFPDKSKVVRFVKRESDLGMLPESMLLLSNRSTTTTQLPNSSGMVPDNLL
ncbi:hypothetical protein MtrunA17_Chr1g0203641 [Medicago truncatula]|uniref:Uncharacterized protein n=1 Tax=Medicago truncatula TaxID=3880 RepID=A0A396K129_MEDTR|nr:hypothetical protein MtrunA17_Chr1g0203641 [Medicago truncatula]